MLCGVFGGSGRARGGEVAWLCVCLGAVDVMFRVDGVDVCGSGEDVESWCVCSLSYLESVDVLRCFEMNVFRNAFLLSHSGSE